MRLTKLQQDMIKFIQSKGNYTPRGKPSERYKKWRGDVMDLVASGITHAEAAARLGATEGITITTPAGDGEEEEEEDEEEEEGDDKEEPAPMSSRKKRKAEASGGETSSDDDMPGRASSSEELRQQQRERTLAALETDYSFYDGIYIRTEAALTQATKKSEGSNADLSSTDERRQAAQAMLKAAERVHSDAQKVRAEAEAEELRTAQFHRDALKCDVEAKRESDIVEEMIQYNNNKVATMGDPEIKAATKFYLD